MPHPLPILSQSDFLTQVVDTNSNTEWHTVQIQISWLLQKSTDLDLHCLLRQVMPCSAREGLTTFRSFPCMGSVGVAEWITGLGIESCWRQNSALECTALQCKEPFIITLPSSRYDLYNVERDVKHQIMIAIST